MTKDENWSSLLLLTILLPIVVTTPILLEHFYFHVPRGTVGWDLYVLIATLQIWSLAFYNCFLQKWRKFDPKQERKQPPLAMMRIIILAFPVVILSKYHIDKYPSEFIAYVSLCLIASSYLMFVRWKSKKLS